MYSINVTGYIPEQKAKEFKQHMRQLISQQNEEAVEFSVAQDMINEDLYQVKVAFQDKESMFAFLKSEDYKMISGSFRALGLLRGKNIIECLEIDEDHKGDSS
jgi:quinol monooxygenase YgiN